MADFFFNALLGAATAKLPYTRLQYIESTGTQYINTGVTPDFAGGDEIRLSLYKPSGSSSVCAFGSRQAGVRNGIYGLGDGSIIVCDSTSFGGSGAVMVIGDNTVIVNDSEVTINSVTKSMPKRVTVALPIFLFCLNNFGNAALSFSGVRFREFSFYKNDILTQHLIPALDSSNVPCMWDTVSNTAKYNAGTGIFNYA